MAVLLLESGSTTLLESGDDLLLEGDVTLVADPFPVTLTFAERASITVREPSFRLTVKDRYA
jgi:hypothetical protein